MTDEEQHTEELWEAHRMGAANLAVKYTEAVTRIEELEALIKKLKKVNKRQSSLMTHWVGEIEDLADRCMDERMDDWEET